jgi:cytochrome c556
MNKESQTKLVSFRFALAGAILALVCALTLSGCASGVTQSDDAQTQNRQYMANVNQIMEEIDAQMTEFSAVIKEGEVVSLGTQLANINNSVDKLKALSVPDAMKDIQADYLTGTEELQEAFAAYVDLYEDVKAPENGKFDYSTYNDRLSEVRSHYEAGIEALQSADQKAADA